MTLDRESQSNPDFQPLVVESQETKETSAQDSAEQSFEEVRQLKESRDYSLSAAQRESKELMDANQLSDLEKMEQAITDAKDLIASKESKRDTRIDTLNSVIDPIRTRVKQILKATETIANGLAGAEKNNALINDEAQKINIDLPGLDELKKLEAKAIEIDSQLDEFEADSYKLVAKEVIDDSNKSPENTSPELKLAAETPAEKQARDTENKSAEEAGW